MPKPTLIDTDILIDAGRGIPDAIGCLNHYQAISSLAISIVVEMELLVGCRNHAEVQALQSFLKRFQIEKINEPISDKAVELLQTYRLSHGLLIADSFIAATALMLDWDFITKNQGDFRFITGLKLLPYP